MPLWIWMDDPSSYGFPCYDEATLKAARDCSEIEVTADDRDFVLGPVPGCEAVLVGLGAGHALSSRRRSADCSPSWRPPMSAVQVSAVAVDRDALTTPGQPVHWLV